MKEFIEKEFTFNTSLDFADQNHLKKFGNAFESLGYVARYHKDNLVIATGIIHNHNVSESKDIKKNLQINVIATINKEFNDIRYYYFNRYQKLSGPYKSFEKLPMYIKDTYPNAKKTSNNSYLVDGFEDIKSFLKGGMLEGFENTFLILPSLWSSFTDFIDGLVKNRDRYKELKELVEGHNKGFNLFLSDLKELFLSELSNEQIVKMLDAGLAPQEFIHTVKFFYSLESELGSRVSYPYTCKSIAYYGAIDYWLSSESVDLVINILNEIKNKSVLEKLYHTLKNSYENYGLLRNNRHVFSILSQMIVQNKDLDFRSVHEEVGRYIDGTSFVKTAYQDRYSVIPINNAFVGEDFDTTKNIYGGKIKKW